MLGSMATLGTPCKTADGHAELAARYHGLTQRHRTLLLLIDGRRTLEEVLELGRRAGVPAALIDELVALGLVEVPMIQAMAPRDSVVMAPPVVVPPARPPGGEGAWQASTRGLDATPLRHSPQREWSAAPAETDRFEQPTDIVEFDSTTGAEPALAQAADSGAADPPVSAEVIARLARHEARLARARGLLLQALQEDGKGRHAMTLLRLRRARSRDDLAAVLSEVSDCVGRQADLFDNMALVEQARRLIDSVRG